MLYKIFKIVPVLSSWVQGVCCGVTLSVFAGTIWKRFKSVCFRKTHKVISSTNIKEIEKKMPNFAWGLEKKKKENHSALPALSIMS